MITHYEISIPPEGGESFTHKGPDGIMRVFATCLMNDFIDKAGKDCAWLQFIKYFPLDKFNEDYLRTNAGIEQDRIDRLCDPYLSRPIIAAGFDYPHVVIVDGNHRIMKFKELKRKAISLYIFLPQLWTQFLLDLPEERKLAALTDPSGIIEFEKRKAV